MANVQHNALTGSELHEPKGADNASDGQVFIADGQGSGSFAYPDFQFGEIYTQISDAATLSTIGTTAQTFPFSNDGSSNTAVNSSANNKITLTTAGIYQVTFTVSFSTSAAGDAGEYIFIVQVGGSDTEHEAVVDMSGTDDMVSVVINGLVTATAAQDLTVTVESDEAGNTDDIVIKNATLTAVLVKRT